MALHALCFKSDVLSLIKILLLFFFLCLSIQESSKMPSASSRSWRSWHTLTPDLYGEKTVVLGRFTHLRYPGQVNFSHIFSYNAWWTIYMRNKELAWLEEWPTPYGRVTRLARPTILHVNTLAHPARSIQSGWDNKNMGKCSLRQSEHTEVLF